MTTTRSSGASRVTVVGGGLFSGAPCTVELRARRGAASLSSGGVTAAVDAWRAVQATRTTVIEHGGRRVGTVEHLFAALGGLGLHAGIAVTVDGPEPPCLDGGAAAFARAALDLGVPRSTPALIVAKAGVVEVERSVYRFTCGVHTSVAVHADHGDSRLHPDARWDGETADFVARIATARTFVFARDLPALAAAGLSAYAPREAFVVIDDGAVHAAGAPFAPDEPARHKLLDLVGDLYLYGGPPRGHVEAERPGHAATHAAVAEAMRRGVLTRASRVP